jgi:sugar phosphate isomerase/epimerase
MPFEAFSYTRRELMFGLAGTALAFSKVRNSMYNPQIAAHTSIWLQEAEFRNVPVSGILEEAFTGTRGAGYGRIELVSDFLVPDLRQRTLGLLEKRKLEPSILYTEGPLEEPAAAENSRRQVQDLGQLMMGQGTSALNFSPLAKADEEPKSAGELQTEAYHLNRMGEELQRLGLELMVHHHRAEMRDNAREWRYLVAHTEPRLVSFCLDVDWAAREGLSPLALMDIAGARLRALHLRNPRNGVDQELLGEGDIDMVAIARFLRQMGYDGYLVVELQHSRETPRERSLATDLSTSRFFMQEVFGSRQGNPPVDMGPYVRKKAQS